MHSYVPLTPVTFLERSGRAFPQRDALIHAGRIVSFGELLHRARCLAQALKRLQVAYGNKVALLTENNLPTVEAHFAIPGVGATIVMLNPWLSADDIIDLLNYCEAKVLIADAALFQKISSSWPIGLNHMPQLVLIGRPAEDCADKVLDYEICLGKEDGSFPLDRVVKSELDPIAINFTSGTTGRPKGVTYSHRAAYLHALGQVLMAGLAKNSKYLWVLPMFHVNGWGHMWANVAVGCTQIIPATNTIQGREAEFIDMVRQHGITHLSGAPRLVRLLAETLGPEDAFRDLTIVTGGAAPSPALVQSLEEMGVNLIHQYGLNETCGPYVICEEQDEWRALPVEARATMRARQGIATLHAGTGLRVVDSDGHDVPSDGRTLGEVVMAGNTVATGYYRNPEATEKAFRDGWFHSGDMAVVHADGYLEIRDRMKDLIYVETEYGWENISSIEIEHILCRNGAIQDAAVIGVLVEARAKESPLLVAFVELKDGKQISEEEIRSYCGDELSAYKRPQVVYFTKLPKTSTGKVRKDLLSKKALSRLAAPETPRV